MKASSVAVAVPPSGVFYMEGYAGKERELPALGVHDDPYVVLLLLEHDDVRTLFVSLDVCVLSRAGTEGLRRGLAQSLGMDEDRIVLSAIHSHSCPIAFASTGITDHVSYGYTEMVTGKAIEASTMLEGLLTEVSVELMETSVRGWYSNRNDRARPFDDSAYAIRFVAPDGSVAGAMLNFNCHATVLGPQNRYLTTDVLGTVRSLVADWVGITPYTFTGASADIGNRQYRKGHDFAELARVSAGIAAEIMKGEFRPLTFDVPRISHFCKRISYDNAGYYGLYRQQLAEIDERLAGDLSFDDRKLAITEKQALQYQLTIGAVDFPIHMMTIDCGEVVFVTFPGELASDLGQLVKGMFPGKRALVIGYANDYQGYYVPARDFGGDTYEAYVTYLRKGGIEQVLDEYKESW